jgi:hypothetical protein
MGRHAGHMDSPAAKRDEKQHGVWHGQRNEKSLTDTFSLREAGSVQMAKIRRFVK